MTPPSLRKTKRNMALTWHNNFFFKASMSMCPSNQPRPPPPLPPRAPPSSSEKYARAPRMVDGRESREIRYMKQERKSCGCCSVEDGEEVESTKFLFKYDISTALLTVAMDRLPLVIVGITRGECLRLWSTSIGIDSPKHARHRTPAWQVIELGTAMTHHLSQGKVSECLCIGDERCQLCMSRAS